MEFCNISLHDIEIYFFLWIIYSFIGWLIEVTLGFIQNKKFVNRGFLIGPYCPIYGTGMVLLTLFLGKYFSNYIVLFVMSSLICGILEYITSYFMEKIFNARWWDYSNQWGNINGRICITNLFLFGFFGSIIVKYIHPCILTNLDNISKLYLDVGFGVLATVVLIDVIVSFKIIFSFRKLAYELRDNTEFIVKKVKDTTVEMKNKLKAKEGLLSSTIDNSKAELSKKIKSILENQSGLYARLLNAFPNLISMLKKERNVKSKTNSKEK